MEMAKIVKVTQGLWIKETKVAIKIYRWLSRQKEALLNRRTSGKGHIGGESDNVMLTLPEVELFPTNPILLWLARGIMVLLLFFVLWALVGKINIVTSAQGRIQLKSQVRVVQPLEKGVIKKILVNEGDFVTQGQSLIELDSAGVNAVEKQLNADLVEARLKLAVNKVLLKKIILEKHRSDQRPADTPGEASRSTDAPNRQADIDELTQVVWLQHPSRINALINALESSNKEYKDTKTEIIKLEQSLPFISKRVDIASGQREKEYGADIQYLQLEQMRSEQFRQLSAKKQQLVELQSMRILAQQKIESLKTESKTGVMETILQSRREISAIEQALIDTNSRNQNHILSAPITGRVRELAIKGEGEVVYQTESLMKIAPDDTSLVVEVFLKSRDVGFVEKKMPAQVKIDTFPEPKYGAIEAVVESISEDPIFDKKHGLTHSMLLAMKDKTIDVEGRKVRLMPGMEVTAEIKTGERRLIEYFFVPMMTTGRR